ncbi:MAG: hypothetical protein U1F43_00270 [Myxococcota bacterium]
MLSAALPLALLFAAPSPPPCSAKAVRAALPKGAAFEIFAAQAPVAGAGAVTLVATDGALATADCADRKAPARLVQILVDPAVDYRARVALPDGRLVFGGTGGLVALDPATLAQVRLTTAPTYPAEPPPGGKACWTAEPGKPAAGWDRNPRDGGRPGRVVFERGGPCGYEAEPTRTTMVVDLTTGEVRPTRNVAALIATKGGALLVGDGAGGCDEAQSRGALWLSPLGGPLLRLELARDEAMGVVGLAETADGALWALTGVCANGGASHGGNLWRAAPGTLDFAKVEAPFRPDEQAPDVGSGIIAIVARGPDLLIVRPHVKGPALSWQSSRDGRQWKRAAGSLPKPRFPNGLAGAIGVGAVHGVVDLGARAYAFTDDGAFVRPKSRDGAWTRVFP